MIRVLLVDDQELVRTGLRGILRPEFGFDVVGECADGGEVVAAVDSLTPDIVLMDVRMPTVDGVQATRALRGRDGSPPVLALTTFDDDEVLAGVLRAGRPVSSSRACLPGTCSKPSGWWPRAEPGSIRPSPGGCWPSTAPRRPRRKLRRQARHTDGPRT